MRACVGVCASADGGVILVSDQMFTKFRAENDKLAKSLRKIESENTELKKKARGFPSPPAEEAAAAPLRCRRRSPPPGGRAAAGGDRPRLASPSHHPQSLSSDAALIRLLEERKEAEGQLKKARARSEKLEQLCRMLQEERKGAAGGGGAGAGAGGAAGPDTPPGKVRGAAVPSWGVAPLCWPVSRLARRRLCFVTAGQVGPSSGGLRGLRMPHARRGMWSPNNRLGGSRREGRQRHPPPWPHNSSLRRQQGRQQLGALRNLFGAWGGVTGLAAASRRVGRRGGAPEAGKRRRHGGGVALSFRVWRELGQAHR